MTKYWAYLISNYTILNVQALIPAVGRTSFIHKHLKINSIKN